MDTATTGTSERPTYFAREARVVYEKKAPGERVLGSKIFKRIDKVHKMRKP